VNFIAVKTLKQYEKNQNLHYFLLSIFFYALRTYLDLRLSGQNMKISKAVLGLGSLWHNGYGIWLIGVWAKFLTPGFGL